MTTANNILSAEQRALLGEVLNCLVPAQNEMPGAGDLGIAGFVESVAAGSAAGRRRLMEGLVQIELSSAARGGGFRELAPVSQAEALRDVERVSPEFFQYVVTQTYRGYYTHETVTEALRYRAPNREDYDPLPFDKSLLEPVKERGQIWVPTNN